MNNTKHGCLGKPFPVVDRELRNYYEYKRELQKVNYRIAEIDAELTSIRSPRIMSPEEAKYQKGTRIYNTINILELFEEQDELLKKKKDLQYQIQRIDIKLSKLSPKELELIEQRYKFGKTLRCLAYGSYSGKSTMARKIDEILMKLV